MSIVKDAGEMTKNITISVVAALGAFILAGPIFGLAAAKAVGGITGGMVAKETVFGEGKKK